MVTVHVITLHRLTLCCTATDEANNQTGVNMGANNFQFQHS